MRQKNRCWSVTQAGLLLLLPVLAASGCGWFAAGVAGTIYGSEDHGPEGADLALLREQSAAYAKPGTAVIRGQIRFPVGQGKIVAPPDAPVFLTPSTTWMQGEVKAQVVAKNRLPNRVDTGEIWWATHTDDGGRFEFIGLPAGEYFVMSSVAWLNTLGDAQTGIAWAPLGLTAGQQARIIVGRGVETPVPGQ